jgi:hypothetical protein
MAQGSLFSNLTASQAEESYQALRCPTDVSAPWGLGGITSRGIMSSLEVFNSWLRSLFYNLEGS